MEHPAQCRSTAHRITHRRASPGRSFLVGRPGLDGKGEPPPVDSGGNGGAASGPRGSSGSRVGAAGSSGAAVSGGWVIDVPFADAHAPAVMTIHPRAGYTQPIDGANSSATADKAFRARGGFVIDCQTMAGVCDPGLNGDAWTFLQDHPFGPARALGERFASRVLDRVQDHLTGRFGSVHLTTTCPSMPSCPEPQ